MKMKGKRNQSLVRICCLLCTAAAVLLAGCGQVKLPEEVDFPALAVSAKGEVTYWMAETFDKAYYDLAELEEMVNSEAEEFNQSHPKENGKKALSVESVAKNAAGDKVVVKLLFDTIQDYRDYSGQELFYGTKEQAALEGYLTQADLVSVKDGTQALVSDILEKGDRHLLIAEGNVRIYGPKKALYVSASAAVSQDGGVQASGTDEYTYIIMR